MKNLEYVFSKSNKKQKIQEGKERKPNSKNILRLLQSTVVKHIL